MFVSEQCHKEENPLISSKLILYASKEVISISQQNK